MTVKDNLMYTSSHEWAEFLDDGTVKVGITDFAQDALGDLVFINLPEPGDGVTAGEVFTDVESVKAVADIFCPVTGTVESVNEALADDPSLLNSDAFGSYIAIISDVTDKSEFMDAAAYTAFCENE